VAAEQGCAQGARRTRGERVTTLDERIVQAQASGAETDRKREELAKERDQLKASAERLVKTVTAMEAEVRNLSKIMPDPVRTNCSRSSTVSQ
jgi:predicted  nucleic acid-binding Zn-ribbon protein